jgi:hypothetical protein
MAPARPNPLHLLVIDFASGTVTRYAKHRGLWHAKRLQRAQCVDPQSLDACGILAAALERFRNTGRAE